MVNVDLIEKICSLYIDDRRSMAMIAKELNISINKVQYWLEKNSISRRNRSKAGYLANEQRFNKFPCKIKRKLSQKEKELLLAGIMLYWAEGWKKNSTCVSFSNSDPKMIQLFLKFLREICGAYEERLRTVLHLYEDQNELRLKKFWSRVTRISLNQFQAPYVHKAKPGTYKKKSRYGTLCVKYCDKKLLEQILEQINVLGEALLNKG